MSIKYFVIPLGLSCFTQYVSFAYLVCLIIIIKKGINCKKNSNREGSIMKQFERQETLNQNKMREREKKTR